MNIYLLRAFFWCFIPWSMPIRLLSKQYYCSLPIMLSRCISSVYRSLNQNLSRRKYHLLSNSVLVTNNKIIFSNIIREISFTFGLALFLLYLFYQLFGNFILIILIICGILCKYFWDMKEKSFVFLYSTEYHAVDKQINKYVVLYSYEIFFDAFNKKKTKWNENDSIVMFDF